jgi:hypothetical protein
MSRSTLKFRNSPSRVVIPVRPPAHAGESALPLLTFRELAAAEGASPEIDYFRATAH